VNGFFIVPQSLVAFQQQQRASEVTTVWRYRNSIIIIIINRPNW